VKLLMENWRSYLAEQEKPQKCVTVGSLMGTIDQMQDAEKRGEDIERLKGWTADLGKKLIGFIPIIGDAISTGLDVADILKKAKEDFSAKEIDYDQISDYPILGHLKIDPELIKVLEDDILKQLDEMYEEQVLSKVSANTCITDIMGINDFIRKSIAVETEKHVVIRDET
jgi:hypothetical protein